MNYISLFMAVVSLIAAVDLIAGNKLGIGEEFKKGISLLGTLTMSMAGILVISPSVSYLLQGLVRYFPSYIDPSIVSSVILSSDMGGAPLAQELCRNQIMGDFNGLIVAALMGCTISFTIPMGLGIVPKEYHDDTMLGFLCGIVTIPLGCLLGGIVTGIPFMVLIINIIPLVIVSVIITIGLIKFKKITLKIFKIIGRIINVILIAGLAAGIFEFLSGIKIIPYSDDLMNSMKTVVNSVCVMTGAFPVIRILSRLMRKPLKLLGGKMGINDKSAMGFMSTLVTNVTTFAMVKDMDRKGIILNSAFAISAAFTLASHLAITLIYNPDFLPGVIVAKLSAGISAVVVGCIVAKKG